MSLPPRSKLLVIVEKNAPAHVAAYFHKLGGQPIAKILKNIREGSAALEIPNFHLGDDEPKRMIRQLLQDAPALGVSVRLYDVDINPDGDSVGREVDAAYVERLFRRSEQTAEYIQDMDDELDQSN